MSIGVYLAVFAVLVVASTVQSASGFGQGLIAAPLLRLLHPDLLPGPIVIAGFVVALGVVRRNSRRSDLPEVVPALAGRMVGIGIAIGLLAVLDERGLSLTIGIVVVGFVILRLIGVTIARTPRTLVTTGVVSGVSGAIAALGGAPMALLYEQHTAARDFRGPLGWYTAIGSAITVISLLAVGVYDRDAVVNGVLLLPPIAVGWFLARWVTPILDRGYLRPLVLALSGGSALVLIAGEVL